MSATDLEPVTGGAPVTDEDGALTAVLSGIRVLTSNTNAFLTANPDWEPSIDSSVSTVPADFFDRDEVPEEFSIIATLIGEVIDFALNTENTGTVSFGGSTSLDANIVFNSWNSRLELIDISAGLDEVAVTFDNVTSADLSASIPGGKLAISINVNAVVDPEYGSNGSFTSMEAAYSVSALVRLAISVDSSDGLDPTGNFIVTIGFADDAEPQSLKSL